MSNSGAGAGRPSCYVVVPEGVLLQHVADEMVLLHVESGVYYGLEPIGTRMLDLACELPDAGAIVRQMLTEYETSPEILHRDLEGLITELEGKGLVERATPGEPKEAESKEGRHQ